MSLNLAFVDSIASAPTTRLDLTGTGWSVNSQTRLNPPKLRRSTAGATLLAHGERYPDAKYGNRLLDLVIDLRAGSQSEFATQIQRLHRELDRDNNLLRLRPPNMTAPVFFRTFKADVDAEDWPTDVKDAVLRVPVLAEPFAYGLPETAINAVTVNFNPASGNGMFVDVAAAAVIGDVETPMKLIFTPTTLSGQALLATRRRGTVANVPFLCQAESMTVGTDTTTQPNSASYSGAGNNFTLTTFATQAGMVVRLNKVHPATPGKDVRGQYRVFARVKKSVTSDPVKMRVGVGPAPGNGISTSEGTVTLANVTTVQMVDFGLCQFPPSPDPGTDMVTGTELEVVGTTIFVEAQRVSGTAQLEIDYLIFVPADDRQALITWGATAPTTDWVLDDVNEVLYGRDGSGRIVAVAPEATYQGGAPLLKPNTDHRIYFVQQVAPATFQAIDSTATVTGIYYPRYLMNRPSST